MIKCYHITSSENLDSIFKYGLLKNKFMGGVVWVFKDYNRAVKFMSWNLKDTDSIIELNVNERKLKRGSCYDTIKEYYSENDIEPNKIIGAYIMTNNGLRHKERKCNIYPCILVTKGYISDNNHFHCVAFERSGCIWNEK